MTTAYPLAWPDGWPRTPADRRQDSKYKFRKQRWDKRSPFWTFAEARDALLAELDRHAATNVVLSSNYRLRRDGLPGAADRAPEDTGLALYFSLGGEQKVMACDMHVRAEENMRSITLALEALRQLERHGGGAMMNRAFAGFTALPRPSTPDRPKPWHEVLGCRPDATKDEIERAYRAAAKKAHPDAGGNDDWMAAVNTARDEGMRR